MCVRLLFIFFSCDLFAMLTKCVAQDEMVLSRFVETFRLVYDQHTLVWIGASFVIHGGDVTRSVFLTIAYLFHCKFEKCVIQHI